jgi:hypothetical protein
MGRGNVMKFAYSFIRVAFICPGTVQSLSLGGRRRITETSGLISRTSAVYTWWSSMSCNNTTKMYGIY